MIDAYTIGVSLALEDGVSTGLAEIGRELATLDGAIRATSAGLDRLRNVTSGLDQNLFTGEASRLLQQAERAASQLPRATAVPPSPGADRAQSTPETGTDVDAPEPRARVVPMQLDAPRRSNAGLATGAAADDPIVRPPPPDSTSAAPRTTMAITVNPGLPSTKIPGDEPPARSQTAAPIAAPRAVALPNVHQLIVLGEGWAPRPQTDEPTVLPSTSASRSQIASPGFMPRPEVSSARRQPASSEFTAPPPIEIVSDSEDTSVTLGAHTNAAAPVAEPQSSETSPTQRRESRGAAPTVYMHTLATGSRAVAPVSPPQAAPISQTQLAAMQSVAPMSRAASSTQMKGDVFLDGTRMGRWIADRLGRDASRPPSGTTGFDPRLGLAWPGAAVGP